VYSSRRDVTSPDLAATLLGAEAAERERILRETAPNELAPALTELGHRRDAVAAEVLALADAVIEDRGLRKVARRELHRLRSMGVTVPEATSSVAQVAEARAPEVQRIEAWASDFDPSGSRVVWLLGERRLGGAWFAALVLNDVLGLQEMSLIDTTRKRFQRDFEESRRQMGTFVSLPGGYALRLIREGVDLAREGGRGVPTRYHALKDVFGEAPGPPERALVFDTISPVEATFNPDWLDQSPALLSEPELAGWHVSMPAELRGRALEAARAPFGGLLVPGHTPEQQALQLVADAGAQAVTPSLRHGLRRRLEETAQIFVATDRLLAARRAVAAARALEDSKVATERHPLLRLLVASGLARLLGGEPIGGRRAGEVLIDLVARAAEQSQASAVETRPSGLILPR
jgi:hypothetical protein